MTRPLPPPTLDLIDDFAVAPDLGRWAKATFIDERGALYNPRYAHLGDASIGWLWSSYGAMSKGQVIAGECRLPAPLQQRWGSAAAHYQTIKWFGHVPDFIITIASFTADWGEWSFCALIEHELCHTAHLTDQYGMPRFTRDGEAILGIVGHDVEQFVDVVARYGAVASGVDGMVRAANKGPSIGQAQIDAACGTCKARIAA